MAMTEFKWNPLKNERLKRTRGISFEEIIKAELMVVRDHPRLAHQSFMLFWHKGYIWFVPFVLTNDQIFLKTIYQSRKYTKSYKKGELP